MPQVTTQNVQREIRSIVRKGSKVMTDDYNIYHPLVSGYQHGSVIHSRGEYVRGDVHTNTVEGFFSLLKRGINGVYHHVSRGHLVRYCDEFAFRYEHRKVSDGQRMVSAIEGAEGKRLYYREPVGQK